MRRAVLILVMLFFCFPALAEAPVQPEPPVIPDFPVPFVLDIFPEDRLFTVYTGPDKAYLIGAEGKAKVSTNDTIRCYGRTEDCWLLVEYEIGENRSRIGYINAVAQEELIKGFPLLAFGETKVQLEDRAELTDDPYVSRRKLGNIRGEVTVLAKLVTDWVYVEAEWKNQPVRGFVRPEALPIAEEP